MVVDLKFTFVKLSRTQINYQSINQDVALCTTTIHIQPPPLPFWSNWQGSGSKYQIESADYAVLGSAKISKFSQYYEVVRKILSLSYFTKPNLRGVHFPNLRWDPPSLTSLP